LVQAYGDEVCDDQSGDPFVPILSYGIVSLMLEHDALSRSNLPSRFAPEEELRTQTEDSFDMKEISKKLLSREAWRQEGPRWNSKHST
jgi:hypothetical protein